MVEDVKLAVAGKAPVLFYGRAGGGVPTVEEILDKIKELQIRPKTQYAIRDTQYK
jgi:2-oxoglutarate ferredoxin oxidoreductase subunit alpha